MARQRGSRSILARAVRPGGGTMSALTFRASAKVSWLRWCWCGPRSEGVPCERASCALLNDDRVDVRLREGGRTRSIGPNALTAAAFMPFWGKPRPQSSWGLVSGRYWHARCTRASAAEEQAGVGPRRRLAGMKWRRHVKTSGRQGGDHGDDERGVGPARDRDLLRHSVEILRDLGLSKEKIVAYHSRFPIPTPTSGGVPTAGVDNAAVNPGRRLSDANSP
jgi:hypothetical protein